MLKNVENNSKLKFKNLPHFQYFTQQIFNGGKFIPEKVLKCFIFKELVRMWKNVENVEKILVVNLSYQLIDFKRKIGIYLNFVFNFVFT